MGRREAGPALEIKSDLGAYWARIGGIMAVFLLIGLVLLFGEQDGQRKGAQLVLGGMAVATLSLALYVRPRKLKLRLEGEQVILSRGSAGSEVTLPVAKVHRIQLASLGHVLGQSLEYLEMGEQNAKKLDRWGPCLIADRGRRERIEGELEDFLQAVREARRGRL